MDGASKFVKGDVIAAMIITAINLIGGIVIGVIQQGMPIGEAAQHFSLLTIGDGLTAQIPALLISVAAGIIVTRSASESDLGTDVAGQLMKQRKAPMVAGVVICAFALVPGLPKLPFLVVGALFILVGRMLKTDEQEAADQGDRRRAAGRAARAGPTPATRPARRCRSTRSSSRSASAWSTWSTRRPAARCSAASAPSAARSPASSAPSSRPSASTTRSASRRTSTS